MLPSLLPDPFDPAYAQERAVMRAADELRRLAPVRLGGTEHAQILLPAVRPLLADQLTARLGRPHLLITRERAAILKIRHKGAATVRLNIPGDDMAIAERVADARYDLSDPLKGPFSVQPSLPGDEAALALMKLAGLLPAALVWPDAAEAHSLPFVEEKAVASIDKGVAHALWPVAAARLPVKKGGRARLLAFRPGLGGREHYALVIGEPDPKAPVLVRLHSECFTGDVLGSLKCDCGEQLDGALAAIAEAGGGILLYLAQEGRGIGLVSKLHAYALQDQGFDTVDANLRLGFGIDERSFAPAAAMLRHLGVEAVRVLTNNPDKVAGLEAAGINVAERVPHRFESNPENRHYLDTKRDRTGHYL